MQQYTSMSGVLCFRGTLVHAPTFGELEVLTDHSIGVDSTGRVLFVVPGESTTTVCEQHGISPECVTQLSATQFLTPGFIDTHIHAPQYTYTGTATDKPLMGPEGWLEMYTFPAEKAMADLDWAARVYRAVIQRTLRNGTTTATYFGTVDLAACMLLADLCREIGQRAFVGKVCMDRHSPSDYCDKDSGSSIHDTEQMIRHCDSYPDRLVQAVVTPRFIPTCSDDLLKGLGELAARYNCLIQSHISESHDEVDFVRSLYPSEPEEKLVTDRMILERFGLLSSKCVMAHGVHLTDEDLEAMAAIGAAVAHCPLSNFFFAGGTLDVERVVRAGVKVGLGTDVAGGYSPCMLEALRHAVVASKVVHNHGISSSAGPGMDYRHAFFLATLGGAQSLGIGSEVGSLVVGKQFDALLVDVSVGDNIDIWPADSPASLFEKWCNLGDDRNILSVWVNGRCAWDATVE